MVALERLFDLDSSVVPHSQPCLTRGIHGIRMEVDTCVKEFNAWKSQLLPLRAPSKREDISPRQLVEQLCGYCTMDMRINRPYVDYFP